MKSSGDHKRKPEHASRLTPLRATWIQVLTAVNVFILIGIVIGAMVWVVSNRSQSGRSRARIASERGVMPQDVRAKEFATIRPVGVEPITMLELPADFSLGLMKPGDERIDIYRQVRQKLANFNTCYTKERQRNPAFAVRLVVKAVINAAGEPTDIQIADSFAGSEMGQCVLRALEGIRFPRSSANPIPMEFVFVFQ